MQGPEFLQNCYQWSEYEETTEWGTESQGNPCNFYVGNQIPDGLQHLPDPNKFSNYMKLINTSFVVEEASKSVINNHKKILEKWGGEGYAVKSITPEDQGRWEHLWILYMQLS